MRTFIKYLVRILPFKLKLFIAGIIDKSYTLKEQLNLGKNNVQLSLNRLSNIGFHPSTIIDVGAHTGEWSLEIIKVFPNSVFVLVEALPDKKKVLEDKFFNNTQVKIYNNLVGDSNKSNVPFYSMETGSSVMPELTNFPVI